MPEIVLVWVRWDFLANEQHLEVAGIREVSHADGDRNSQVPTKVFIFNALTVVAGLNSLYSECFPLCFNALCGLFKECRRCQLKIERLSGDTV